MSSINSRGMVDKLIANNGRYGGDPQVVEILSYRNIFDGGLTYKLIYKHDARSYILNNLVGTDVRSIWTAKGGSK